MFPDAVYRMEPRAGGLDSGEDMIRYSGSDPELLGGYRLQV